MHVISAPFWHITRTKWNDLKNELAGAYADAKNALGTTTFVETVKAAGHKISVSLQNEFSTNTFAAALSAWVSHCLAQTFLERAVRAGNIRHTLFWARWYKHDGAVQENFLCTLIVKYTHTYSADCIVAWIAHSSEDLRNSMFTQSAVHRSHYYSSALAQHTTEISQTALIELLKWNHMPLLAQMATRHSCDIDFLAAACVVHGKIDLFDTLANNINFNRALNHVHTYEWTQMYSRYDIERLTQVREKANAFLCSVQHKRLSETVRTTLDSKDTPRVKRKI